MFPAKNNTDENDVTTLVWPNLRRGYQTNTRQQTNPFINCSNVALPVLQKMPLI
jgi:hypothetical protein